MGNGINSICSLDSHSKEKELSFRSILPKIIHCFYWRSDTHPFSSSNNTEWKPYEQQDNEILEKAYQKFIINKGPSEVHLKKAAGYKVDLISWTQISLADSFLQRRVERVELVENMEFQSIHKSLINVKYFWRSDANQFSADVNAIWEPYEDEENLFLEKAYQNFINQKGPAEIILINSKFKVNFSVWKQFSNGTPYFERPCKRQAFVVNEKVNIEQKYEGKKEAENDKKYDINSEYFWRSDPNPFSSEENAIWSPYDYGDSIYIEKSYKKYLYSKGPEEVDLSDKYKINFLHWRQISKFNQTKQRTIVRGPSNKIKLVFRKDRWGSDFNIKDHLFEEQEITTDHNVEFLKFYQKNQYTDQFLWEVGNDRMELIVLKEIKLFEGNRLNMKVESYIKELKDEINKLSNESEFQNKVNKYDFSDAVERLEKNPETLYDQLVQMYMTESFLYRELNNKLRSLTQEKSNKGCEIKYFYLGLMAAMKKLTENTKELLNHQFSNDSRRVIKVFRGSGITKEEVDFYQNHKNVIRQINCFLSTSIQKNVAMRFINNQESELKALYEYDLITSHYPPFTYLGGNELDIYGEREVLIHSGSILQITSITEDKERADQFLIKGKIISSGWKGYFQYVIMGIMKNDWNELNLDNNGFGEGGNENMKLLKEALIENKSIVELKLSLNNFGEGEIENIQILKEIMAENASIKALYLNNNGFGNGKIENMMALKMGLADCRNVEFLYLAGNGFGKKMENLLILKEGLKENKSLKELYLYNNELKLEDQIDLMEIVGEKIKLIFQY